MPWTKRALQSTIFGLLSAVMKVHPIPHTSFETTRSYGLLNFYIFVHVMKDNSFIFSSTQTLHTLEKRSHEGEFFKLLSGWVKIHRIPHVIFETASQFVFFNFVSLFIVMRDNSSVLF